MKSRTNHLAIGAVAAAAVLLAGCSSTGSSAEEFAAPTRATMIVPFAAGGGSDVSGRAVASGLEGVTGLTVTVENREGGAGAVGYSALLGMEGREDVLLASELALVSLPLAQDVSFRSDSFTPIMNLGGDYALLMTAASSEFETCADVVTAAKAERVVTAVTGATGIDEITVSLIEQDQDVEFARVPYESGGEVVAALLGGHVDVAPLNPSEVVGQLESGDLRALCAFTEERYAYEELAAIPTAAEQGIDVAFAQFRGFIAPGGISEDARKYWIEAAEAFADSEQYTDYIESNMMQPNAVYGDEFVAFLDETRADVEAALG
ncbi:tripartite tricarboxylate transporter substrate binding protein [Mycetocola miduiensis]|uniref:Putative tricarboxylic transport membrane protein n=1 Tax=Mycetocola miduiensis TaxID=995034 RepID=A0A1I5AHT4_9MICO|nr:tripartite tricarboxylate transporter substrate binding protein [Mycetocola miduiensis]SFN61779.1 putative tricarboxylic transport membrane protein [Mycetocola miduiensis]